jgi:hypothetical protein
MPALTLTRPRTHAYVHTRTLTHVHNVRATHQITPGRGTMDYISGESGGFSEGSPEERVTACFSTLTRDWFRLHRVPFVPLALHLADGTPNGHLVHLVADAQEPPGDRKVARWRHKVIFSGSATVRLSSAAALTHLSSNVRESLLQHHDGRQPNTPVAWKVEGDGDVRSVDDAQGMLALLTQLEREWMREILRSDDTFEHPAQEKLESLGEVFMAASGEIDTFQTIPTDGAPWSTAGMVDNDHDGADHVTTADRDAMEEERERHKTALEKMSALVKLHAVTDEAMETIGEIIGVVAGGLPPTRLRKRVVRPFLFNGAER